MSSQTRGRRVAALVILAAPHALALVAPMHAPPLRAVRCNYVTPQQVAAAASADDLVYGRGTMADLSSIVALAEEEFGKDYTDPISKFGLVSLLTVGFGLRLNRDDHAILTCKAGTDLLGYVEVSPQPAGEVSGPFPLAKWAKSFMGPLTPYLANLLVRPDARRRGVGGALVTALIIDQTDGYERVRSFVARARHHSSHPHNRKTRAARRRLHGRRDHGPRGGVRRGGDEGQARTGPQRQRRENNVGQEGRAHRDRG